MKITRSQLKQIMEAVGRAPYARRSRDFNHPVISHNDVEDHIESTIFNIMLQATPEDLRKDSKIVNELHYIAGAVIGQDHIADAMAELQNTLNLYWGDFLEHYIEGA